MVEQPGLVGVSGGFIEEVQVEDAKKWRVVITSTKEAKRPWAHTGMAVNSKFEVLGATIVSQTPHTINHNLLALDRNSMLSVSLVYNLSCSVLNNLNFFEPGLLINRS